MIAHLDPIQSRLQPVSPLIVMPRPTRTILQPQPDDFLIIFALIPLMVLLAVVAGSAGFRVSVFDAVNLIGFGFAAAIGTAFVAYRIGAP